MPWRGPLAATTVAGTVSGYAKALENGSLPVDRLLRDAVHFARCGVVVTAGGAEIARAKSDELRYLPGAYASIYEPHGRPLREGELLLQPALAETLERLSSEGLDSFYRGALAADIASDLAELGSPVAHADLSSYQAKPVTPLSVKVTGARLFNMTAPTQGIASLLILAIFDRLKCEQADSFDHIHSIVEATKQAFLWRDEHCGDLSYMSVDPQSALDNSSSLNAMASQIDPARAMAWPQSSALGDTTWFAAADGRGQVVSCIQSTYFEFGSGVVLPRSGITWQNRGSSFRLAESGWNALKPGRKPFHTLNPALARFDDNRVMAYGTMGGEGQPQTQAAVFSRYARFGIGLQEAVSRPRWLLGRTWGAESTSLKIEDGFNPAVYLGLISAGHDVERVGPLTSMMGHAGAIVRHSGGFLEGATDPRSDGLVAAW